MKTKLQILIYTLILISFQSCYTVGYQTIGGNYFVNYDKDTSYYYNALNNFAIAHPELMIDEFKFESLIEQENITSKNKLHPLYPLVGWANLHTWFIKSPNENLIYEIGLFNCGFDNTKHNSCTISLHSIYNYNNINRIVYDGYSLSLSGQEGKALKKQLLHKFESEIVPLMKPYFDKK